MRRRIWTVVLAAILIFNVLAVAFHYWRRSVVVHEAHAKENQLISHVVASRAMTGQPSPISMIGNLVETSHYRKLLPLSEAQKDTIREMERVVRESRYRSMMADAEASSGPPAAYEERVKRHERRRREAMRHAQRVVLLGLLTEEQTATVVSDYLRHMQMGALNNDSIGIADRIGFTEEQVRKLEDVNEGFKTRWRSKPINPIKPGKKNAQAYYTQSGNWSKAYKQAMSDLLTPGQRDQWSKLAAKRPALTTPPDLGPSPASDAEAARIDREGLSPVFRSLDRRVGDLGLDAEQRTLLERLERVTRQGLLWIGQRGAPGAPGSDTGAAKSPDQVSRLRSDFLKHAEQVALLGILTESQAAQIQGGLK